MTEKPLKTKFFVYGFLLRFVMVALYLSAVPFFFRLMDVHMADLIKPYWFWWVPLFAAAYYGLAGVALDLVGYLERLNGVMPDKKRWSRF